MKKTLFVFMTLFMPLFIMAQETTKLKEVGIVFNDLDNFGLTFKTGSTKSLWRFTTLLISGNSTEQTSDSLMSKNRNFGFGVEFGKEYRKNIVKNLDLRLGADLSFRYTQSKLDHNDKSQYDSDRVIEKASYQPGINLVCGFNYLINEHFVIGAELLPGFTYMTGKNYSSYNGNEDERDISGFNYGLSNTSASLTLAYRF